jgi:hypothetical protein
MIIINEEFPKYLMNFNGNKQFLSLKEAAIAYGEGHNARFGRYVLYEDFKVGRMTWKHRKMITNVAAAYARRYATGCEILSKK